MKVQVNTDHNIHGHEAFIEQIEANVEAALGQLSEHITRVEVHLSDENAKKGGQVTKKKLGKKHYQRMQKLGIQAKLAKKKLEKEKVEAYIKKHEQRNLY